MKADLLGVQDKHAQQARLEPAATCTCTRSLGALGAGRSGTETSPAITIHPDATLPAAARVMNSPHVKRLPWSTRTAR